MGNWIPSRFIIFPVFILNMTHLSIPNCIPMFSLNILAVWISESRVLSLLEYNFRSSMNSSWFIVFPVQNSCHWFAVLSTVTMIANPFQKIFFLYLLPQVSQHHKLAPPSRTSSHKKLTIFFAMPIIFKLSLIHE